MNVKLSTIILILSIYLIPNSLFAQYSELGLNTKATSGTTFGPIFNANPVFKWGDNFDKVQTIRAERTYLHYSQYGGNQYGSLSTGGYYGFESRKELTKGLYLIQGPEVGGYFTSTGPFTSIQPRFKYQFGLLLRLNDRINISVSSPLSTGLSFEKTDDQWNQTLFTFDIFNEMNNLSLTYIL